MIGFFIPIAEALIAGYIAYFAVYSALIFAMTRMARSVLLDGSSIRWSYTALHALTFGLAAMAGAYICCGMSPLAPYGNLGFPLCLAIALILIVLRGFRQLPGQMTAGALALNFCGILGGTVLALYAHHAFAAFRG